jgi:carbonic anhydrase
MNATSAQSFTSELAWQDGPPDCLVVCCSDHRFERQVRDLVLHLNFKQPHILQFPSGAVLTLPLTSAFNFVSKAVDKIVERVVEMKQVREIILVGHHDCGAYKAERIPLIAAAVKRLSGKSVHDLQRDHLAQAARRIHLGIRGVRVRAFFADVVGEGDRQRVRFVEV